MAGKDEAAQRARAEELRREIARLRDATGGARQAPAETEPPANPHEFVERRMRELEREEEQAEPSPAEEPVEKSP